MFNNLDGTRVYLSGPMDFVGSRIIEKYLGWRAIVSPILKALGVTVLDPWNKPHIRGHFRYGQEGVGHSRSTYEKDFWTNEETRLLFDKEFRDTVHVDLRMTDMADFVLAFVPTNIYSVGTAHEIVVSRWQHKPVLLISPPIKYDFFPEIATLPQDAKDVLKFYGLKENPNGIPSQWWGFIVGGNNMYDGFGWEGMKFKSSSFYPQLLETVLANSEPCPENEKRYQIWQEVSEWVRRFTPFQKMTGGILDNIIYDAKGEDKMLAEELKNPNEEKREYFWYNTPYSPKRSVLYKLLCVASGHIQPKLCLAKTISDKGQTQYDTYETIDDDWMLISAERYGERP